MHIGKLFLWLNLWFKAVHDESTRVVSCWSELIGMDAPWLGKGQVCPPCSQPVTIKLHQHHSQYFSTAQLTRPPSQLPEEQKGKDLSETCVFLSKFLRYKVMLRWNIGLPKVNPKARSREKICTWPLKPPRHQTIALSLCTAFPPKTKYK